MIAASLTAQLAEQIATSWPWYIIRGAGLMAFLLMLALMLSGIGLVTGMTFRFLEPIKAWALHRVLGICLLATVMLHVLALLFDAVMGFSVLNVLVPFTSSYKPLWVGAGVFAMYAVVAVVGTSLLVINRAKRTWRLTHYASYAAFGLTYVHALFTGTDLAHGFWRWAFIGLGLVFGGALIARLYIAGTVKSTTTR